MLCIEGKADPISCDTLRVGHTSINVLKSACITWSVIRERGWDSGFDNWNIYVVICMIFNNVQLPVMASVKFLKR